MEARPHRARRTGRVVRVAALAALAAAACSSVGYPEGARREAHYRALEDRLLFDRAEAYYAAGDYAAAAAAFRDHGRRSRGRFRRDDSAYRYADSLLGLEQWDEAARAYAGAARRHRRHARAPEAWLRVGVIRERLHDTPAAIAAYERLVERYPETDEAEAARGRLAILLPPPAEPAPAGEHRRPARLTAYPEKTEEYALDKIWPGPPFGTRPATPVQQGGAAPPLDPAAPEEDE